jgi:hypothetical protein
MIQRASVAHCGRQAGGGVAEDRGSRPADPRHRDARTRAACAYRPSGAESPGAASRSLSRPIRDRFLADQTGYSVNLILRGWANYYRYCAYAGRVFTSLDWYGRDRLWRWMRKKYPKAKARDILGALLPSARRPKARVWRDGPVEQYMLAWTPVCRFRHAWMRTPDFALSSGEPGA